MGWAAHPVCFVCFTVTSIVHFSVSYFEFCISSLFAVESTKTPEDSKNSTELDFLRGTKIVWDVVNQADHVMMVMDTNVSYLGILFI